MTVRVLIVDDDPVTRLVCEHILTNAGHDVAVADDAESARAVLVTGDDVDLVLCDYQMPGDSGLDLLESLEQCPPFVLLTGTAERSEIDDPRVESVDGFLTKPVQSDELVATIDTVVAGSA